jgi:hypothetical protein
VQVTDGRFVGVDVWAEIERAIATARGGTPPRRAGSAYTPFDRFEAKGRLDGTVIRNESFDVMNSSMRARGQGTVNYGTGALDLALTARLLEAPAVRSPASRSIASSAWSPYGARLDERAEGEAGYSDCRGSRPAAASGGRRDREEAQAEALGQAEGPARAMSRSATLAGLAIALLPAAAQALSVESLEASLSEGVYRVALVARVDAPVEDVAAVLTDYAAYRLLDPRIRASTVLPSDDQERVVRTVAPAPALLPQRPSARAVGGARRAATTVIPERSELKTDLPTTWQAADEATSVTYSGVRARLLAVGDRAALRSSCLKNSTLALFGNVEKRARER